MTWPWPIEVKMEPRVGSDGKCTIQHVIEIEGVLVVAILFLRMSHEYTLQKVSESQHTALEVACATRP